VPVSQAQVSPEQVLLVLVLVQVLLVLVLLEQVLLELVLEQELVLVLELDILLHIQFHNHWETEILTKTLHM
jgi:hypothetical protein